MTVSQTFITYHHSPVGKLKIAGTATAITELLFWEHREEHGANDLLPLPALIQEGINQLDAYFKGTLRVFEVPVLQEGTAFQLRVWNELMRIPFGKTISYLELAKRLGDIKSIRAAASTNGKNRISIIVPCHRVIGANQELVGYGGGLPNKRWLLEHEAKIAHGVQTLF